eukprot:scaffold141531_cov21-Tisochrysis_lutea.AAC.1
MPLRLYRPGAREGRGTMYRQWMVLTWCKGRKGLIVEVGARLCLEVFVCGMGRRKLDIFLHSNMHA